MPAQSNSDSYCKKANKCTTVYRPPSPEPPAGPIGLPGPPGAAGSAGVTGPAGPSDNFNKCFPVRPNATVNIGDIVTTGKGDDTATVHKVLCEQWDWAAGIITSNDVPASDSTVATDGCGNVYVAGWTGTGAGYPQFYSARPSGNSSGISTVTGRTPISGNAQLFIGKLKPSGIWEWAAAVDQVFSSIEAPSLATDKCGNIYLAGRANSNQAPVFYNARADGNTSDTIAITGRTGAGTSIFVAKISPSGMWEWATSVDRNGGDLLPQLATDGCGNLYVAGRATGEVPRFYSTLPDGTVSYTASLSGRTGDNDHQIFVAKLKPTGVWEWSAAIDALDAIEQRPAITVDSCGSVYVAGDIVSAAPVFYNTLTNGANVGDTSSIPSFTGKGGVNFHIFIGKIKWNGVWEWAADVDTVDGSQLDTDASLSGDCYGNVYVAGTSRGGPVYFFDGVDNDLPYPVSITGRASAFNQIFVGKIKSSGKWEWAASVDGDGTSQQQSALDTDNCGNIYVSGSSNGNKQPLFYDGVVDGSSKLSHTGKLSTSDHVFVSKLTPDGSWQWAAAVDSDNTEQKPDLATDNCGNVYVVGNDDGDSIAQPKFFDAGANGNTLTNASILGTLSVNSIFVGKLANEAHSAPLLGLVTSVDESTACVDLLGTLTVPDSPELTASCAYYINCTRDPQAASDTEHCPSLTTDGCSDCCCPNRCVGVAIDNNRIIWDPEYPICDKKKVCCCRPKPTEDNLLID